MCDRHSVRSRDTAARYTWGDGCDGFVLVDTDSLSVIEELVPPGATETWHLHTHARQFFYILEGSATMHLRDADVPLTVGEGLEVSPGIEHRFANHSDSMVRFLVMSTPSTRHDRVESGCE